MQFFCIFFGFWHVYVAELGWFWGLELIFEISRFRDIEISKKKIFLRENLRMSRKCCIFAFDFGCRAAWSLRHLEISRSRGLEK